MKKIFLILAFCFIGAMLFAYSAGNGLIEFEIPDLLEIQEGPYAELSKEFEMNAGIADDSESLKIVLQQKGLNNLERDALDRYCRIIVNVDVDDSSPINNKDFENEFNNISISEKTEFFDLLKKYAETGSVIKEWKESFVTRINDLFAFHLSYVRASTVNKGDVFVDTYQILAGIYTVNITCSYRLSDKSLYETVIKQFLESFKLNYSNRSEESSFNLTQPKLYSQMIPWTNKVILWPENTINWISQNDSSGRKKITQWSDGYDTFNLTLCNFDQAINDQTKYYLLMELCSQSKRDIGNKISQFLPKLKEEIVDSNHFVLRYSYIIEGFVIEDIVVCKFLDNRNIAILVCEYFDSCADTVEEIINSFN